MEFAREKGSCGVRVTFGGNLGRNSADILYSFCMFFANGLDLVVHWVYFLDRPVNPCLKHTLQFIWALT